MDRVKAEWERFYLLHFDLRYDLANLAIPSCPSEGWRMLVIGEVSMRELYGRCKELFPCWVWTDSDVDGIVAWNERDVENGPYAIWVREGIEADEELKGLSANDIREKGITAETLAERLIHELKFFTETGEHLDVKNVTLCAGSRDAFGSVPGVCWRNGEMIVLWSPPFYRGGSLRSRQAISSTDAEKLK